MANTTVQALPLSKRLNKNQQEKRALKIEARKTVAQTLMREGAITRGGLVQVAGEVVRQAKMQRLQWVAIALLFILLGVHVHLHGGLLSLIGR